MNEKNLFDDVIRLNETPTNSVRLPASTLKQLFQDTKYNLKDIRKNKKVKPVEIGLLPKEMKQIESVKARKELFIKIVLPLILEKLDPVPDPYLNNLASLTQRSIIPPSFSRSSATD